MSKRTHGRPDCGKVPQSGSVPDEAGERMAVPNTAQQLEHGETEPPLSVIDETRADSRGWLSKHSALAPWIGLVGAIVVAFAVVGVTQLFPSLFEPAWAVLSVVAFMFILVGCIGVVALEQSRSVVQTTCPPEGKRISEEKQK